MIESNNLLRSKTRSFFREIKNFLAIALFLLFAIGITYLCYYVFILQDSYLLNYTGQFFTPLAAALNPDDNSLLIYRNTGIKLLLFDIIVLIAFRFIILIENFVFKLESYSEKQKEKNLKAKEEKEYNEQFEIINKFSICISFILDKENNNYYNNYDNLDFNIKPKKIPPSKEELQIGKIFCERLKTFYKNKGYKNFTQNSNKTTALISSDFNLTIFNKLLDDTLVFLALFKKQIEKQYNNILIYTITLNAYKNSINPKRTIQQHNRIKNIDCFKNRILSLDLFATKYKHLNATKYPSTPIGLYVLENDDRVGLNLVIKNLNSELEKTMVQ